MNDEARAELDRIVAMEPEALTEADKAFLMARRSYLSEEQRIKFDITEEVNTVQSSADESEGTTNRRGRKTSSAKVKE